MIEGVRVSPLKKISHPKGDVFRGLKSSEKDFVGFGEAYFTSVVKGEIKGWKCHTKMIMNIIVPVGNVRFVIYDDREDSLSYRKFYDVIIGASNYSRIIVPNKLWVAFQGVDEGLNLLLNIANIEHNPVEAQNLELSEIVYSW